MTKSRNSFDGYREFGKLQGHLFILTGASGSGKTTLLNMILSCGDDTFERAVKYAERPVRASADSSEDDIISVESVFNVQHDIAYIINNCRYAVSTNLIRDRLRCGKNVLIIISDIRVVRAIRQQFRSRCVTVYISSFIGQSHLSRINASRYGVEIDPVKTADVRQKLTRLDSAYRIKRWDLVSGILEDLNESWTSVIPELSSLQVRAEKIRTLHMRYVDNIDLFDFTVLNYRSGKADDMLAQFLSLYTNLAGWLARRRSRTHAPRFFVVCAPSGAGKGELMEAVATLGQESIALVTKYATREPKQGDRRDGMVPLGKSGAIPKTCDLVWTFHAGENYSGVTYGVDSKRILQGLESGTNQIVVANFSQIPALIERFSDRVSFLYLHRAVSEEDILEYQLKNCETIEEAHARIEEVQRVYEDYVHSCHMIDHVLLNTSAREDLFDQMMQIVKRK